MDSRYTTSVSVLHSLMIAHLEELELDDVSEGLKEQIPVIMLSEKEKRTRDQLIEIAVVDFFEDCRTVEPGYEFVKTFHAFMETMIRGYRLGYDLQEKFQSKVDNVEAGQLLNCYSIQNLCSFVQGVTYANPEGENE